MTKKVAQKLFLILLLFPVSWQNSFAQNIKKDLLPRTWYCNSAIGSDTIFLSPDNTNNPKYELKFFSSGKVALKSLKKRGLDTTSAYSIKNRSLVFHFDLKDSVKTFAYEVKKVPKRKAFHLNRTYSSCYVKRRGDDTIVMDKFTLMFEEKRKVFEREQELTVFSQKKALHNDSIDYAVWGQLVGYVSDTLLIDSDEYVEHNFYKKYTDSLHFVSPLLIDTTVRIKVPTKNITGIYAQREPLTSITTNATFFALGGGLLCVTASLLSKNDVAATIFAQTGVIAFLTLPVSVSLGMIFSKQKFRMKPGKKPEKIWKIERHMPNTVVTQRNQNKIKSKKANKK
jgi:hypothetical protein